jgi:uncharacterized peroxidase-related enzyme
MTKITVPSREQVSPANQQIFDSLKDKLGMVPNIYATYALSENALGRYLSFASGKTSLNNKEKEVVNLVTSQVNGCTYCQAAHTAIGKMNGFSDEQILSIRSGEAPFDPKLHALATLVKELVENRGKVSDKNLQNFFDAGYTKENLVDMILNVAEKASTNFLHNVTQIPIDFPEAPVLQETNHLS